MQYNCCTGWCNHSTTQRHSKPLWWWVDVCWADLGDSTYWCPTREASHPWSCVWLLGVLSCHCSCSLCQEYLYQQTLRRSRCFQVRSLCGLTYYYYQWTPFNLYIMGHGQLSWLARWPHVLDIVDLVDIILSMLERVHGHHRESSL